MEKEKTKEYLKCILTEDELKVQAEKMAQCLSQIAVHEGDLKSVRKQIESDIARCQADLTSAVEKFRSRFEMRNVDCETRKDFETNTVQTFRLDTGEMIRERALTAEERQMMLDLDKKKEETPAGEEKPPEDLPDLDEGDKFYNEEKKESEAAQ